MSVWLYLLAVAGFGGVGAVLRFVAAKFTGVLPWGILIANTAASLVAGLFIAGPQPAVAYGLLVVGFAGGLSTFSSWAAQTASFWVAKEHRKALYNAALNLLLPAFAVIAGAVLSFTLLK